MGEYVEKIKAASLTVKKVAVPVNETKWRAHVQGALEVEAPWMLESKGVHVNPVILSKTRFRQTMCNFL